MNKVITFLVAVALALPGATCRASDDRKPRHVMSLNLCTDQLLLQLLPPQRISSVTYISRLPGYSFLTAQANAVPINYASAEEVLREHPDLVVAGTTSTTAIRALLKKVAIPLVEVPPAENFDEIRKVTRLVAHAVGEDAGGEALISHMDATLGELAAGAPTKIIVAGWDGAGNVPAKGTLFDTILTAAGGVNVVAGIKTDIVYGQFTAFDLEQLVAMRPDVLAYGRSRAGALDLASQTLQHPIVRKLYAGRQITYPETLYNCGLPQSADAARDLRRAMLAAMQKKPAP
jgi:iron complex transport system substrate-binding protein